MSLVSMNDESRPTKMDRRPVANPRARGALAEALVERVWALCAADPRVNAAMMYGSFTYGEADPYSDIEFLLFFENEAFAALDQRAWLEQIAPVLSLYRNDYGIQAAIFEGLVRGEFHFHTVDEMGIADAWPGVVAFRTLDSTLIVDKSGRLAPRLTPVIGPEPPRITAPAVQHIANALVNSTLFGVNVALRGEHARALEMLSITHRHLLHLARAAEGADAHWLTPSRCLEQEISPAAYARFVACTAALDPAGLRRAYTALWAWGRALIERLRAPFTLDISPALLEALSARIDAWPECAAEARSTQAHAMCEETP